MKRNIKQKSIVFLVILALLTNTYALFPAQAATSYPEDIVKPANIAIALTGNDLSLGSLGKLYCYGETQANPNLYDVGVKVELQQYDDGWDTIKTWEDYGNTWAIVSEYYYVESGYAYRLKVTHYAYDIDTGEEIESFVKYSDTVSYNVTD